MLPNLQGKQLIALMITHATMHKQEKVSHIADYRFLEQGK